MITAIVQFKLPADSHRADVVAVFRQSVPRYQGRAGLVRKYYLLDEASGTAGAVYLWETRAAAENTYNEAWRQSFIECYGADPTISYFDTPVIVDNLTGESIEVSENR